MVIAAWSEYEEGAPPLLFMPECWVESEPDDIALIGSIVIHQSSLP